MKSVKNCCTNRPGRQPPIAEALGDTTEGGDPITGAVDVATAGSPLVVMAGGFATVVVLPNSRRVNATVVQANGALAGSPLVPAPSHVNRAALTPLTAPEAATRGGSVITGAGVTTDSTAEPPEELPPAESKDSLTESGSEGSEDDADDLGEPGTVTTGGAVTADGPVAVAPTLSDSGTCAGRRRFGLATAAAPPRTPADERPPDPAAGSVPDG